MKDTLSILLVDDHPMTLEGYKNTLLQEDGLNLSIETAENSDSALSKIRHTGKHYDVIFLDIQIPPSSKGNILSGEDLGLHIREACPNTKIVIITMFTENIRIRNIIRNVNPNAFLIKSEVIAAELLKALKSVIKGKEYYSKTVRRLRSQNRDSILDDIDRQIIYQLSKGTKTRNLVHYIPLSLGAIEKRKRKIKEAFEIEKGGDREVLDKAKKLGFL